MTTVITLREQGEQDACFLRGLFAAGLDESLGLSAWPPRERETLLRLQYDARERDWLRHRPPERLLVIEADGDPAGRIWLCPPDTDGSRWVTDLAVAPRHRGRGVATAALTALRGPLRLSVSRGNLPALRLYHRLGFVRCGGTGTDLLLHRPAAVRSAGSPAPA